MMRSILSTILAGIILVALCSSDADAQSRRESRRAKKRALELRQNDKKPEVVKKPVATVQPPEKKKDYVYPETVKKDRYRIDVLAPLYLSELVQDGKVVGKTQL